jgi:putative ABC transport system permease protein
MRRADGVRLAVHSLVENPLRTFLTLLGISIGVTAVILVVSIIQGLNGYVSNAVSGLGPNVFIIEKYGIIKGREAWILARRRNQNVTVEEAEAIRRQATTIDLVATKRWSGTTVKFGRESLSDVQVQGIAPEGLEVEPFEMELGRHFTPQENDSASRVCFLGYDVAQNLFAGMDPIGETVSALDSRFRVIGVAERKGSLFGRSRDNFIVIPFKTFLKLRGQRSSIQIYIRAAPGVEVTTAIDEARTILRTRRHLDYNEADDFGLITSSGVMDFWRDLTEKIFNIAIFVVSISLVVGGIVIMNIMLLSVVERTREIGVRKAIGARDADIRFQFLAESVMLCAMGGLIGVGVAWTLVWLIANFTPLPASFPLWAPWLAIGVTSGVGIFFGLHPARQAAQLDPIEALRAEAV